MEADTLRRLHYAAAIACGVFAALSVHIALTVFGAGLDAVLRDAAAGSRSPRRWRGGRLPALASSAAGPPAPI